MSAEFADFGYDDDDFESSSTQVDSMSKLAVDPLHSASSAHSAATVGSTGSLSASSVDSLHLDGSEHASQLRDEQLKPTVGMALAREIEAQPELRPRLPNSVRAASTGKYAFPYPAQPLRKFTLYETATKFYLVASNRARTRFRLLKIDRTNPDELDIEEDHTVYDKEGIEDVLTMIDGANSRQGGLGKGMPVAGLLGFIRFTEGYYLVLLTSKTKVAQLGGHDIYAVSDTSLVSLKPKTRSLSLKLTDESRYKNIFELLDLTKDFFFSYTYDMTHTLQFNMNGPSRARQQQMQAAVDALQPEAAVDDVIPTSHAMDIQQPQSADADGSKEEGEEEEQEKKEKEEEEQEKKEKEEEQEKKEKEPEQDTTTTTTTTTTASTGQGMPSVSTIQDRLSAANLPYKSMYVWNGFLMDDMLQAFPELGDWCLPIIQGFVRQKRVFTFGRPLHITLMARRSIYYAGTRYRKRGINHQGQVANDVEIEQILHEGGREPEERYASIVQVRGSIPLFWSQDNSIVVPKPAIFVEKHIDPFFDTTRLHFQDLFARYGAPIMVFNLVKTQEKKPREALLNEEYQHAIGFLNRQLPRDFQIAMVSWDLHRVAKTNKEQVLPQCCELAEGMIRRTGFFYSGPRKFINVVRDSQVDTSSSSSSSSNSSSNGGGGDGGGSPGSLASQMEASALSVAHNRDNLGSEQNGVIRTNCIDSLDRTNVAQFCIGKVALGFQLYEMGWLDHPKAALDERMSNILMDMYEEMGHQLSQQYAGSEALNQMGKYQKGGWQVQSKDVFTNIRRYYNNNFTDAEKQDAINLFLGNFVPGKTAPRLAQNNTGSKDASDETSFDLWELESDYYLHNSDNSFLPQLLREGSRWWEDSGKRFVQLTRSVGGDGEHEREEESNESNEGNEGKEEVEHDGTGEGSSSSSANQMLEAMQHAEEEAWKKPSYFEETHKVEKLKSFDKHFAYAQNEHIPSNETDEFVLHTRGMDPGMQSMSRVRWYRGATTQDGYADLGIDLTGASSSASSMLSSSSGGITTSPTRSSSSSSASTQVHPLQGKSGGKAKAKGSDGASAVERVKQSDDGGQGKGHRQSFQMGLPDFRTLLTGGNSEDSVRQGTSAAKKALGKRVVPERTEAEKQFQRYVDTHGTFAAHNQSAHQRYGIQLQSSTQDHDAFDAYRNWRDRFGVQWKQALDETGHETQRQEFGQLMEALPQYADATTDAPSCSIYRAFADKNQVLTSFSEQLATPYYDAEFLQDWVEGKTTM